MSIGTTWDSLSQRYRLATEVVTVAGRAFELVKPESVDDLLDEAALEGQERLPYWAEVWASGRIMTERLANLNGRGQRMLELGCGLGLVALVAVEAGFDVLATDYFEQALEFTALNAARNGVAPPATRLLDWRAVPDILGPDDLGQFDLVVGADVLYERPNNALVAAVLDRCLKPGGLAIVTDPGRRWACDFPARCAERGLLVDLVAQIETVDGNMKPTIDVLEILRG